MRISDWSSDVCSSDLPPVVGEGHVEETGGRERRSELLRGDTRRLHHHADAHLADVQRDCVGEQEQQHRRQHECNEQRRRIAQRLQAFLAHQRSEEHTSELQSLMRISYAVFCLKQKITQKENKYI